MNTKFLLALCLSFISLTGFTQLELPQVIPASPNTASLGKYGEIPIGLFTGSPQINIPLYELKTLNLSVPITMRYNSNGIRVDEYSSNVGMGWDLSAGGVITRQVNDDPDENQQIAMPNVYAPLALQSSEMSNFLLYNSTQNGEQGSIDSNPDIFSFNFNGYSGSFYLNTNSTNILLRTPIFLEPSAIKVEVLTALGNNTESPDGDFKITDPNGIIYYFGGTNAVEKSMSRSSCTAPPANNANYKIENAWHLRKIIHPNGDKINFIYESKTISYDNGVAQNITRASSVDSSNNCSATSDEPCLFTSTSITPYLKEINGKTLGDLSLGKVLFTYSHKTEMQPNMDKLDHIAMLDKNNSLLKEYLFEYQNYTSSSGPSGTIPSLLHKNYHRERYFLLNVAEKSKTGILKPAHEFEYYSPEKLPSRFSFSQDYWGYYNGVFNINLIDSKTIQSVAGNLVIANGLRYFSEANRDPKFFKGIYGLLKKITYPTKGSSTLYYDPHSYSGTETIFPPITTNTATAENFEDPYVSDEFTTSIIPFDQDADLHPIIEMNELLEDEEGSGGPTTDPLTFIVEVRDAATNQLSQISEKINSLSYSVSNPITITTSNYNKDYVVKLTANKSYKVKVSVARHHTKATVKLHYYTTNPTYAPTNVVVGGLRIAKVETSDNNGGLQTKNYHYGTFDNLAESSGKLVNRNSDPAVFRNKVYYSDEFNQTGECTSVTLSANSAFPIYGVNHIGYSSVIEEYGDNFSGGGTKSVFSAVIHSTPNLIISGNYVPTTPRSINSYSFGLELEKSVFKKIGSNYITLNKTENVYIHDPQLDIEFESFNVRKSRFANGISGSYAFDVSLFDITRYILLRQWRHLEKTVKTQYDENGFNPLVTTQEYFYDNTDHFQITRTKTTTEDDDPILTKTLYAEDVISTTSLGLDTLTSSVELLAINKLKTQNRKAEPIQVSTYKDRNNNGVMDASELLSVKRTNYKNKNNPQPNDIQTLKGIYNSSANKLEDRLVFHSYYSNGNIKEVSKTDGTHISYIWGYNEQYPIAKIENATGTEVSGYVLNLQTLSNQDIDIASEELLRSALNNLRTQLPNAMISTYTYDPLIGVTSMTDPRGYTMYYEYDEFNRLKQVKDAEGNIVSENEYHYKDQQE